MRMHHSAGRWAGAALLARAGLVLPYNTRVVYDLTEPVRAAILDRG